MLQPSALTPWEGTTGKRSCFQVSSVRGQDGSDVLPVKAGAVPHSTSSSVTRDKCSLAGCLSLQGGVGGTREGEGCH